jgi:hypothetical protein
MFSAMTTKFDKQFYEALATRMLADPEVQADPKAPKTVEAMVKLLQDMVVNKEKPSFGC